MKTYITTQFLSGLIVVLLLLSACGKRCEKMTETPMNPKLKASLQGANNYHYWLLINDLGDTIEISCDGPAAFTFGPRGGALNYPECEAFEYFIRDNCQMISYLSGKAVETKPERKAFSVLSNLESSPVANSYPFGWTFNWLGSEQKIDNRIRINENTFVRMDKFTDYNKKEYQNVFNSFGMPSQTYFIISPDVGFIGFFGTNETPGFSLFKPQDTLRLVEVR